MKNKLNHFLLNNLNSEERIKLFISGENGDSRFIKYYEDVEDFLGNDVNIVRYKHLTGECGVSSSMALWLSYYFIQNKRIQDIFYKKKNSEFEKSPILIYNNYRGIQHSFILVSSI